MSSFVTSTARAVDSSQFDRGREPAGLDGHVVGMARDQVTVIDGGQGPRDLLQGDLAVVFDAGLCRVEQDIVRQGDEHATVPDGDLNGARVDHRRSLAISPRNWAARFQRPPFACATPQVGPAPRQGPTPILLFQMKAAWRFDQQ